ncbi:MAG: LLM class flavin-dependent oxidoreductase [Actinomycetota bacterium]|nr:LLM class flavin-dependent oxidoreductase [Actinomycetota bacterium]
MNGSSSGNGAPTANASPPPLRCALVGADTLLLECAQMLLNHGHELVAMVAGSARVAAWAADRGVPVLDAADHTWVGAVDAMQPDYLFAITHLRLLPADAIAVARRMAINFHDGPLPEYAGLNTPVWGLLHGEAEWGVSWHRITDGVDTGEVLVQDRFPISPRDTSLSLNTSNVEHALDTFATLLHQLEHGTLAPAPQPADAQRTEYRRARRPSALLDWSRPADEVDRLVRALHFGPHPNPVAAPTVWHPSAPFLVGVAEPPTDPAARTTDAAPGTVLAIDEHGLTVACADRALRLGALTTLDGAPLTATRAARTAGLSVGDLLGCPPTVAVALQQFAEAVQPSETSLVELLSSLAPAEFPWPVSGARGHRRCEPVPIEPAVPAEHAVAALAVLLARLGRGSQRHVALALPVADDELRALTCSSWPLDLGLDTHRPVAELRATIAQRLAYATTRRPWLRDVVARTPALAGAAHLAGGLQLPIGVRLHQAHDALEHSPVVLQQAGDGWSLDYDTRAVDTADAQRFVIALARTVDALRHDELSGESIDLLDDHSRRVVLQDWNATGLPTIDTACIHQLIELQVASTPHRTAVVQGNDELTYQQLHDRSQALATVLRAHGVAADVLVGVHVERSIDLLVAVLGVLLAGGAYVPLDPGYPADRLQHMVADSGAPVLVCQRSHDGRLPLPSTGTLPTIVFVDDPSLAGPAPTHDPAPATTEPHHLAYCIYTSGSTGVPKGVLVEHRNVANFFAAMDAVVPRSGDDTWFAVTSLSFDISVLELLYTLARGMRVVLHTPNNVASTATPHVSKGIDFSLFYFSGDEAEDASTGKYRLLLEGAKFADANGFCAVWTPERHFHAFGGLYPNPAITAAAVAAVTERVGIRAGSVVLPLHHPVEVAEAWSVVDNLSNGRVGVAFASGWQPNDFIFRPQNYSNAKEIMFESIAQVQQLWQGETLTFEGPEGMAVDVATLPRPVQPTLPVWVTTAGNPETFAQAGTAGANVLTHLLGQSVEQLTPKLAAYRAARAAAGHDPATGIVTLMLHTFVGDDDATVCATVREPLRNYLQTSFNLVKEYAWSFPAFQRPDGKPIEHVADLADDDVANLAPDELDAVLEYAFQRYYDTSGLFGTPARVAPFVERLKSIGVDEVACLLDFGVASDTVLAGLPHLAQVLQRANAIAPVARQVGGDERSLGEQLRDAGASHVQCTPSMARLLTTDPIARDALAQVPYLFVGGEALPAELADELRLAAGGTVTNMYGPTETTIWSSTWQLQPGFDWVPIGTPVANTQFYVLDAARRPVPPGVTGDLWIGGDGVVRGYHQRPELSAERFATDPFRDAPHRMYFTGDLARWREQADGSALMEFLGRSDHQVKLRGYRIELGEVEARLRGLAGVADCVAVVREDAPGDQQLVAYVVAAAGAIIDPFALREALRGQLPEVMVPAHVLEVRALPRTPNGKLDRAALPPPSSARRRAAASAPGNDVERGIADVWSAVLDIEVVGADDNFFDIGGHSLLVVRLHRRLQEHLERSFPLTDLYRFPTVRSFATSLADDFGAEPAAISAALDRAARRRANLRGRDR